MIYKLKPLQIRALRLAIMECKDSQAKYPNIPELDELVDELEPLLPLLQRAESVTVEV